MRRTHRLWGALSGNGGGARRKNNLAPWLAGGLLVAAAQGCFDAERLTEARQDMANGYMLGEVDLGRYHVGLPNLPGEPGGVVDFHAFGQVANREKKSVQERLELRQPELRHRILLAVRALDERRIDEPKLESLRQTVADVVNDMLGEELIQGVGFYDISYY